jgi:O-antigen ligase
MGNFRTKIDDINSYLLIAFAFFLPLSVAIGNIFAVLIFLFWLVKADFKNDFNILKNNLLIKAVFIFLGLHVIGLLWTSDLSWGLHILKKELKFLFLPVFMLFIKKEHIKYYIYAFLLAMTISEVLSYGIWFDVISPFGYATLQNPTPFNSHITYNPFLAFTIYILAYYVLFSSQLNQREKIIYSIFIITMSINMFITGGRAGQVMYFMVIIILVFQYYKTNILKSIFISFSLVFVIFIGAYNISDIFNKRVNSAINTIQYYENNKDTSLGIRIVYTLNSLEIIKENPVIGVGTGDFKSEYLKINSKNTPQFNPTENPHNMYILELVQFGIFGLCSLLFILFSQVKISLQSSSTIIQKVGLVLPILFGIIMISDSYLLGHYTTMLFIFFSSILYKDYGNEKLSV